MSLLCERSNYVPMLDKGIDVSSRCVTIFVMLLATSMSMQVSIGQSDMTEAPSIIRLGDGPIITQDRDSRMGRNVQGQSLIRVPDRIQNPLGKYCLYFADHRGTCIRLACADTLLGTWKTHEPGSLQLEDSFFPTSVPPVAPDITYPQYAHIASPDIHVRDDLKKIRNICTRAGPGQRSR
jgi:hypothetical protein